MIQPLFQPMITKDVEPMTIIVLFTDIVQSGDLLLKWNDVTALQS